MAGDSVNIRGGTYVLPFVPAVGTDYWEYGFHPSNSGSPGSPITFQAYEGETVFFDSSASAGQINSVSSYGAHNRDYIVYDGIDTESYQDSTGKSKGVAFKGANHCTVKNADIVGSPGTGNNSALRIEGTTYIVVQNVVAHGFTGPLTNCTGVMLYSSDSLLVENSEFYGNAVGFYDKDGSTNNTYRYNYFHDNTMDGYLLQKESTGPIPHDISIYQNIFRGNADGLALSGAGTKNNISIYNNVFIDTGRGVFMYGDAGVNNLRVFNNLFYGGEQATTYTNAGPGLYSDYNQFYNTAAIGDDAGANVLVANPHFVNAGGADPEDYKRIAYPADGRGGSYPSVRGAYITGDEVIGVGGEAVVHVDGGVQDASFDTGVDAGQQDGTSSDTSIDAGQQDGISSDSSLDGPFDGSRDSRLADSAFIDSRHDVDADGGEEGNERLVGGGCGCQSAGGASQGYALIALLFLIGIRRKARASRSFDRV